MSDRPVFDTIERFVQQQERTTLELIIHHLLTKHRTLYPGKSDLLTYKIFGRQSRVFQRRCAVKPGKYDVVGGVIYYNGEVK